MRPLCGKDSSLGQPPDGPKLMGQVCKTPDSGWKPEILKSSPIGHFVRFLLRADKTMASGGSRLSGFRSTHLQIAEDS